MKRSISEVKFEEMRDKTFELVTLIEMLCEVCQKPLGTKQKTKRKIRILTEEDYRNLLRRSAIHDRAEIDLEQNKIFFYDHDFPGDVHAECVEKL